MFELKKITVPVLYNYTQAKIQCSFSTHARCPTKALQFADLGYGK